MTMLAGREYLRVSMDRSGRARSVEEQHDDNARAGQGHGIELNGESYSDVSVSASRYTSKIRGDFARLMTDLERRRFSADVLVLWEPSRGSRRVSEWCALIEACEAAAVRIFVTTHGRLYDPANGRDRRSLLEDAVDSEYESWKVSQRTGRSGADQAAKGLPHGRTPYGYLRRYDERTRRLVAQEPEPGEAAVVAELFDRLDHGHSLRAIATDFDRREIRTRTGKRWTSQHLRDIALRPLYAGIRAYEPGNRNGRYRGASLPNAVPASWPALVDEALYWRVRALLLSPGRRKSRPGSGVHLLSMIATCGAERDDGPCGGLLTVRYRDNKNSREYWCRDRACVRIGADDLDAHAEDVMLAYLAQDQVVARLRARDDDDAGLVRVRSELARERGELAGWRQAAAAGQVSVTAYAQVEPAALARIAGLEQQERELVTPPALMVIEPGEDVAGRWDAAPMSARRQVARLLCSPAILGTLRVSRSPRPGHKVDPADRVTWDRDTP